MTGSGRPRCPTAAELSRRGFFGAIAALAAIGMGCRAGGSGSERLFRIALPYEVDTVDPHATSTTAAFTVLSNVYEPLVFTQASQGLRPALAERWSNPDPLTWIFELRAGVRFHSGRPLEAQDVVSSLKRVLHDPTLDVRYYVGEIAEVDAVGARSVRVRAHRKTPILLYKLAHVFIVPAGRRMADVADGTGPYSVVSWQPGRRLELQRNERYWGSRAGIRRASFSLDVDPQEILRGLSAGTHEMAVLGSDDQVETLSHSARYKQVRRSALAVKYLGFDLGRTATPYCPVKPNPFRDRRVRQACHLALDRRGLVSTLPRQAVPANQLVPREVFGFAPKLPEAVHDPDQARSLLREAGLPDGFHATLHTREILRDAAAVVARQLAVVGVRLEVKALADTAYFTGLKRREFSLWVDRWGCTTGDSAELFETAIHTQDPALGLGNFNESGYSNPRLDLAIREALELESAAARRAALEELMRQTMEDLPWIPLFTDQEVWAIDRGYTWTPRVDYWLHIADIRPAGSPAEP